MENVHWKVAGMTCSNCALTIQQYLKSQGLKNISVNPVSGKVAFDMEGNDRISLYEKGISDLGYTVVHQEEDHEGHGHGAPNRFLRYFLLCLPFTLVLMLHMLHGWLQWHWLMNPWIHLILATPVYLIGMSFFGRSAWKSIRNGMPNMNVLIALGATAAFGYSLAGTLMGRGQEFLFYETAATIITLVFLGNFLEEASMNSTGRALRRLVRSQKVMANMIAYDGEGNEQVFPMENDQLREGDLVLVRTGEQVPADSKILSGNASLNEAIITGESIPVEKQAKDKLIGGSIVVSGSVKAQVTQRADQSVLASIIRMVETAQSEKPPVQQLADRISAVFVPAVLGIALLCFILNWVIVGDLTASVMRSIAVLVIACPCAMGLATPAAIAVGLGRAARNGILFRHAKTLERFKDIRQVVFDKTGTVTTGDFKISAYQVTDLSIDEGQFKRIAFSLERYSDHPLARAVSREWKVFPEVRWSTIEEIKGLGLKAISKEGDEYRAGSFSLLDPASTIDPGHNIYITRNGELLGWIDLQDEIRPEVPKVVAWLEARGIRTILLSGDRQEKAQRVAEQVGIGIVLAQKTPEQKQRIIEELNATTPTAMVGDGINDAPALANASIGISLAEASQLAVQTADVVLMNKGLDSLPSALGFGKHTYKTIRENLFWAFFYNIIAIPVAAVGLLTPTVGALVMGLSDVVLALNSARLYVKKVDK